jgi:ketosteroid isomerase-like protein
MRMMKIKSVVVLSCLVLCGVSRAHRGQSPEEDIGRFVERYDRAWNHKDAAGIEHILAANYVYFTSKGRVQSRQQVLDMALSPKYSLASAERSEIKVYRTSNTAVVSSRWKGHGTYDGQEFHDDQRCSIVLVRENQRWQILSEHCTQIVGP